MTNVLLTCAGRRHYLVRYFREALAGGGKTIAVDASLDAPAMAEADVAIQVPPVSDPSYIDTLLDIAERNDVRLILSLNDLELPVLAATKERFLAKDIIPVISAPAVIDLCFDKLRTPEFLNGIGIETPTQFVTLESARAAIRAGQLTFPLVVKPRWGTGSIGLEIPEDDRELELNFELIRYRLRHSILAAVSSNDWNQSVLIQARMAGQEYGLDIINDLQGRHVATFVRRKISMRSGETDRAEMVHMPELIELGNRIGRSLQHVGLVDCDLFLTPDGPCVLELNPRFGGGYPFSHEAGINMPAILLAWADGKEPKPEWLQPKIGWRGAKCDIIVRSASLRSRGSEQESAAALTPGVVPLSTALLSSTAAPPFEPGTPHSWPYYDDEQIEAASRILRSGKVNYWTGEECRKFEDEYAAHLGCRHAIALANGTVALELALRALNIGPGDEVIVPSRTFLATANCVVVLGATPVFADVDRDSQNITARTIEPLITPRTRAVICVHLAGWPCDMNPILDLARRHGLKVVEDCAQAHGAEYRGRPAGTIGDVGCFSFCQDKIITTGGEGGLLVTDDEAIWKAAWSYKDHGKGWDTVHNKSHPGLFRWLHDSVGTNWRLTEMQAALGRIQLKRLPGWIETRRRHAQRLNERLVGTPGLRLTGVESWNPPPRAFPRLAAGTGVGAVEIRHSYYKYYCFVRLEDLAAGWDRDRIARALIALGVPCGSGSCPEIYEEQAFRSLGLGPAHRHPVARELGETSLMFQVHPTLTDAHIDFVADRLREVMATATASSRRGVRVA